MQPILPYWNRKITAIVLVLIFCSIGVTWKTPVQNKNYFDGYIIPEFTGMKKHTYRSKYIDKVWYDAKTDKYEAIIGISHFLRMRGLPDMTLTDVKTIANLRKRHFHKLAKENPSLFDPIDSYVVHPKREFNCDGFITDYQTHHGHKTTSMKIFEFVHDGENYSLSLSVTFNDASIMKNQKLQTKIHRTWQKVLNGLLDTCGN